MFIVFNLWSLTFKYNQDLPSDVENSVRPYLNSVTQHFNGPRFLKTHRFYLLLEVNFCRDSNLFTYGIYRRDFDTKSDHSNGRGLKVQEF